MGKIFIDQVNAGIRPAFDKLVRTLEKGDQVTIPSLSCLGSTFSQICEKWDRLIEKEVSVLVQDYDNDASAFMAYLEKIQGQIREDQKPFGNSSSKPGAKPKQIPEEFETLRLFYKQGQISSRDAAERLNVSHTTFLRWCRTRTT